MVDTVSTTQRGRRQIDLVGQTIVDRYRVTQKLGHGGFGAVFLAEDLRTGAICALKALRPALIDSSEMFTRFLREASLPSSIGHPNIVEIWDTGRTSTGTPFFVMEYLEGEDLGRLLAREGPLPWPRVFTIALQICSALHAAHQAGVLHRDVKPENFFLIAGHQNDFIKVLDFGIAKKTGREQSVITQAGAFVGTPEYMSPEQARGDELDRRVDVYGVGILLYNLVTGEVPFKGGSELEILNKHAKQPPAPPSQLNPAVPDFVERVILRALAKAREDRYLSMQELAQALRDALERDVGDRAAAPDSLIADAPAAWSSVSMPVPRPGPAAPTWLSVVAGLTLGVVLLAAAAYFFLS